MTHFYDETHPLYPDYRRLYDELVPASGACQTVEGELLRAASRIGHDYTNNGFGNNWSGALAFLDARLGLRTSEREALAPYARGRVARHAAYDDADPILRAIDELTARVVGYVAAKPVRTPFEGDMFDLQEKDDYGRDDEDEDEE